jgi:hypothetical protein
VSDVLAGRAPVVVGDLFELIHRVNPTGLDLDARTASIRYAEKARLQSLLIRRFAAELDVRLEPTNDGVVSIRHRYSPRDACHAVLAVLDEDARSWVRRAIDLESSGRALAGDGAGGAAAQELSTRGPSAPPPASPDGEAIHDLVELGERALVEFDYEAAEARFRGALERSGGAPGPAERLLSLLVDVLVADADALALEPELSEAARAEPAVRALLGLAAARRGDREQAFRWIKGVSPSKAATVVAALASFALHEGDLERAEELIAQLRALDPASPSLHALASELARRRAERRGPDEAALQRLLDEGHHHDAARRARELLAKWPDSETARRVLRTLDDRQRRLELERLWAEAEGAEAQGDAATALLRWRAALALASKGQRETIEARLLAAERVEAERRAAERVERARALLDEGRLSEGLHAYADLEPSLRARVRQRVATREIEWIERILQTKAGARPAPATQAVMALGSALEAAATNPTASLARLEAHHGLLDGVPDARKVVREAQARLAAEQARKAREEVAAAQLAWEAGDLENAEKRIQVARLRDLPEDERPRAEELRDRIAQRIPLRALELRLDQLTRAGAWLEARQAALRLAEASNDEGRARFREVAEGLGERVRRAFRLHDVDPGDEGDACAAVAGAHLYHESSCRLSADGRTIALAMAAGPWVLVTLWDVAESRAARALLLRTPDPMGYLDVMLEGSTLWLLGDLGAVLELDLAAPDVRRFHRASELLLGGIIVERLMMVPGTRLLWAVTRDTRSDAQKVRVLDLDRSLVLREVGEGWRAISVLGLDEPRVACEAIDRPLLLFSPRGALAELGRVKTLGSSVQVAAHPSGRGLLVLTVDYANGSGLYLSEVHDGVASDARLLDGANGEAQVDLATALDAGLAYVTYERWDDGGSELVAFAAAAGGGLERRYAADIAEGALLVQDAGARRAAALWVDDRPRVAPLGPERPRLPGGRRPDARLFGASDLLCCGTPHGFRDEAALALSSSWRGLPTAEVRKRARDLEAATDDAGRALEIVFALHYADPAGDLAGAVDRLFQRFPDDPEVRLVMAEQLAAAGAWSSAYELFRGVSCSSFDDLRARHLGHLLGCAAIVVGDVVTASRALYDAFEHQGRCELDPLAEAVHWMEHPCSVAGVDADEPVVVQLLARIAEADARWTAGDAEGTLALLDRGVVWQAREVQSLARLCEAFLAIDRPRPAYRMRKAMGLAMFLEAHGRPALEARSLLVPRATWGAARLADLAARGAAWLDAAPEGEAAPPEGTDPRAIRCDPGE